MATRDRMHESQAGTIPHSDLVAGNTVHVPSGLRAENEVCQDCCEAHVEESHGSLWMKTGLSLPVPECISVTPWVCVLQTFVLQKWFVKS